MEDTMKRITTYGIGILVIALFIMSNLGIAQAEDVGSWKEKTFSGKVVKIDKTTSEITIVGAKKNEVVFALDTKIKNLDKIAVGDKITGKCYFAYATEIRSPSAEEKQAPFAMLDTTYDAPANTAPAGGKLKMFRDVVKVVDIERALGLIQVKDTRGKVITVDVSNTPAIGKEKGKEIIKVGNTILVTYVQPLLVSIKKK